MTRDELVKRVEQYLGLASHNVKVFNDGTEAYINFRSPTGVFLFRVGLSKSTGPPLDIPVGEWWVSGYGSLLRSEWLKITGLHSQVSAEGTTLDNGAEASDAGEHPRSSGDN